MTLLVLPRVASFAAGVQVATLRQWVRRGHIPAPVNGLYDLLAVEEYSARRDAGCRFPQALAARRRRGACKTG